MTDRIYTADDAELPKYVRDAAQRAGWAKFVLHYGGCYQLMTADDVLAYHIYGAKAGADTSVGRS